MWLESFLRSYPGQLVVISHERDLLNNVVDHILHLEGGKVTLYPGGYNDFERQRAERIAQLAAAKAAQDENGRAHVWTTVTNAHLVCRLLLDKIIKERLRTR